MNFIGFKRFFRRAHEQWTKGGQARERDKVETELPKEAVCQPSPQLSTPYRNLARMVMLTTVKYLFH